MPRTTGGDKRSSWQTFHRRLFLVRRLMCGSADAATLIADARATFDAEIYPADAHAALRHDLTALRTEFGCVIRLVKDVGYVLEHLGKLVLLDLTDTELDTLAFLSTTFATSPLPNGPQIASLLDRITALLPPAQQCYLQQGQTQLQIDSPTPTSDRPDELLVTLKSVLGRQQIAFDYCSSFAPTGHAIRHQVAPYNLLYRDSHTYLDAYCYTCGAGEPVRKYHLYRLDRIVTASFQVLPDCLPPHPPTRPTYPLRYRLSPAVATQRDIALWFPGSQVAFAADGSAEITAQITDLWQARQVLLRYRDQCRVLEPAALITMMRESVLGMLQIYTDNAEIDSCTDDDVLSSPHNT